MSIEDAIAKRDALASRRLTQGGLPYGDSHELARLENEIAAAERARDITPPRIRDISEIPSLPGDVPDPWPADRQPIKPLTLNEARAIAAADTYARGFGKRDMREPDVIDVTSFGDSAKRYVRGPLAIGTTFAATDEPSLTDFIYDEIARGFQRQLYLEDHRRY